ncbi:MAG: zinc ABC transporter substrate-binding protein [Ruminococcaceae bacterium]|nr:zinc ABC transporter substrate-binding protein [Oscillospiraceae bacterium]
MKCIKKIAAILLSAVIMGGVCGCASNDGVPVSDDAVTIVTSNFALYDFARVYETDGIRAEMLIAPGTESHDLEATLSDVSVISEADIFVYAGGESDLWVESLFASLGEGGENIIRINALELVGELHEHTQEEHEHTHEADEHTWTSIPNAITLIEEIGRAIQKTDETKALSPKAEEYVGELNALDEEYRSLTETAKRLEVAVADRFPFTHMAEEYGIAYSAAFDGCTSNVEVPLSVISGMIEEVKVKELPAVFYIEFSDRTAVDAVCRETGAVPLLLHSCHNVTKEEFSSGVTYLDLMTQNLENLKIALN